MGVRNGKTKVEDEEKPPAGTVEGSYLGRLGSVLQGPAKEHAGFSFHSLLLTHSQS